MLPDPAGSAWADALAAIAAAARALTTRFGTDPNTGLDVGVMPVWEVAVSVSGGRLLAPGWPRLDRLEWINTSRP